MTSEVLGICYWIPNITVFIDFILKAFHCLAPMLLLDLPFAENNVNKKCFQFTKLILISFIWGWSVKKMREKKKNKDNKMSVCVYVYKIYMYRITDIYLISIYLFEYIIIHLAYIGEIGCRHVDNIQKVTVWTSSFYRTMKIITLNCVSKSWKNISEKRISVYLLIHTYIMPTLLYLEFYQCVFQCLKIQT